MQFCKSSKFLISGIHIKYCFKCYLWIHSSQRSLQDTAIFQSMDHKWSNTWQSPQYHILKQKVIFSWHTQTDTSICRVRSNKLVYFKPYMHISTNTLCTCKINVLCCQRQCSGINICNKQQYFTSWLVYPIK